MPALYKTFFDLPLLVLWGNKISEDGKQTRLTFGFRDGRPRMTVNTGQQGKESMIIYPADVPNLTAMMLYLKDVCTGVRTEPVINESLAPVYVDDKPTPEKKVRAQLIVGKSKDGIVYIAVIADNYPKIVFPFKTSDYHVFRNSNKEVIPASEVSVKLALGYADQVLGAITLAVSRHAEEEYESGDRKLTSIERPNGGRHPNTTGSNYSSGKTAGKDDLDDLVI